MQKTMGKVAVWAAAVGLVVGPAVPGVASGGLAPGAVTSQATVEGTERLAGANRYETAVAVSQHLYPAGADVVFVARGTDFPDALAGGPAAAYLDAPVLLISSATTVPNVVRAELARLAPREIIVLGGGQAVGTPATDVLGQYAPVSRLAGTDRYATAAAVASLWGTSASTVYVASGRSYPDALAGGAAAAHQGAPVLLSTGTSLSAATADRLRTLNPSRVVVLGGEFAVPASVVDKIRQSVPGASLSRYAGTDRYGTAATVAANVWPQGSTEAFYATGLNYADALAGVPAAAAHGAPLLLVKQGCAPATTQGATADLGVITQYVLGGSVAVADGATTASCGVNPPVTDTVLAVLEDIPVKGRAPLTGYDRAEFGPDWTDAVDVQGGRNGCDTRNDVLRRDLDNLVVRAGTNGCVAETGWLDEPFSGDTLWFERGVTSQSIHIDHLVPLSDAWQKGAQQITFTDRKNFANDPLNLWAVDGGLNSSKGDGDAATWLPPNRAIRCDYVAYQVAVKAKYDLWVTQAEKDAITTIVNGSCPTKKIPVANDVPALRP
ncbi:cell wall-binding repeat-containing protein [Ornithinimicrobium sp. LYQ121]|uniref:cell wall-binding repeat-containing protein n=1 Tax=Ornithinimicrobium sp. LYQ121 TaxID=3378801 RepID=UPI003851EFFF